MLYVSNGLLSIDWPGWVLEFQRLLVIGACYTFSCWSWGDNTYIGSWTMHIIDNQFEGADGVDIGDINRDGLLDAVAVFEESGRLIVYLNIDVESVAVGVEGADFSGGGAGKWGRVDVSGGVEVKKIEDAVFADLNADGRIDAVISAMEAHAMKVGVHWLTDPGNIMDAASWKGTILDPSLEYLFLKIAVGQLDGRNGNDIVVGTKEKDGHPGKILWYPSPPDPSYRNAGDWKGHEIADTGWVGEIRLRDMDGDGDLDVVFKADELAWLENPGPAGPKTHWQRHPIGPGGKFCFCRMPGDSVESLVAGVRPDRLQERDVVARKYRLVQGEWHSEWIRVANLPAGFSGTQGTKGIDCGDIDGNGSVDLAMSFRSEGAQLPGVYVFTSHVNEAGAVTWRTDFALDPTLSHPRKGIKPDNLRLADVDADGDLDVITTEENSGKHARGLGLVWFENPWLQPTQYTGHGAKRPVIGASTGRSQ